MSDSLLDQLIEEAEEQDQRNREMQIHGRRIRIPLEGRTLDAIYYPAGIRNAPLMIALHGGGFLMGGCALDDEIYHAMRESCEVNVISIGYRKGEGNPFPAALDDVYDSIQWLITKATLYQFNPKRILISGVGAGATLAMSCSLLANRRRAFRLCGLLLIEPMIGVDEDIIRKTTSNIQLDNHWKEEQIAYVWFPFSGNSSDVVKDPLFMPVSEVSQALDPRQKIIILTSCDPLYLKRIQPFIRNLQDGGACVEWRVSETENTPGFHVDWTFLNFAIRRCS